LFINDFQLRESKNPIVKTNSLLMETLLENYSNITKFENDSYPEICINEKNNSSKLYLDRAFISQNIDSKFGIRETPIKKNNFSCKDLKNEKNNLNSNYSNRGMFNFKGNNNQFDPKFQAKSQLISANNKFEKHLSSKKDSENYFFEELPITTSLTSSQLSKFKNDILLGREKYLDSDYLNSSQRSKRTRREFEKPIIYENKSNFITPVKNTLRTNNLNNNHSKSSEIYKSRSFKKDYIILNGLTSITSKSSSNLNSKFIDLFYIFRDIFKKNESNS